jgi:hypothetical protein
MNDTTRNVFARPMPAIVPPGRTQRRWILRAIADKLS